MNRMTLLSTCAVLLGLSGPAAAHTSFYSAQLLGSSEVPASTSPATGATTVTIDFDFFTMRVEANFSGLTGLTTAAHIHCCVDPGSNVGVATQLPSFEGFPLGVAAGTYDHTFDMSNPGSYRAGFVTDHGGTISSAFNALVAGLDAGQAYLNIHTSTFLGGEIRGLLKPVPVPAALWLFVPAVAGLLGFRRAA